MISDFDSVENIEEKGENAGNHHLPTKFFHPMKDEFNIKFVVCKGFQFGQS